MARVHIAGLDALKEALKEFPLALQERAVTKGVRKAAATLRTAMRRGAYAAPLAKGYKRTNKLRNSLRSAVARKPQFKGKAWVGLKKIPGEHISDETDFHSHLNGLRPVSPSLRDTLQLSP